jgi:hypothetical protein
MQPRTSKPRLPQDTRPTPRPRTEPCRDGPTDGQARGRAIISTPLPGFRAHHSTGDGLNGARGLPGLRARSYRDSEHTAVGDRNRGRTGNWGRVLLGFKARAYREAEHEHAGSGGTNERAATGILGIKRLRNLSKSLNFSGRNFVSSNSCSNSSTRVAVFLTGGRGRCPRMA